MLYLLYGFRNFDGRFFDVYWNEVLETIVIKDEECNSIYSNIVSNDDVVTIVEGFFVEQIDYVTKYFYDNCYQELLDRKESGELQESKYGMELLELCKKFEDKNQEEIESNTNKKQERKSMKERLEELLGVLRELEKYIPDDDISSYHEKKVYTTVGMLINEIYDLFDEKTYHEKEKEL